MIEGTAAERGLHSLIHSSNACNSQDQARAQSQEFHSSLSQEDQGPKDMGHRLPTPISRKLDQKSGGTGPQIRHAEVVSVPMC